MEKCGKLWRSDGRTPDRREAQGGAYLKNGVRDTTEMRACSACAGDYEDPDRTAWPADDAEEEGHDAAWRATKEEFPAEE